MKIRIARGRFSFAFDPTITSKAKRRRIMATTAIAVVLSVLISLPAALMAATFNHNSIGLVVGKSFLTSAVKTVSDQVDINESDLMSGFQYVRHFNSESALQIDVLNFGSVELSGQETKQFTTQDDQLVILGKDAAFKVSTQSVALSAQFRSWFSWRWAAQISLGAQRWQRKVEYRNLINNPSWPETKAGTSAIWSFGLVYALSDVQMSLLLGSAHFGDDAIMHSQQVMYAINYGF